MFKKIFNKIMDFEINLSEGYLMLYSCIFFVIFVATAMWNWHIVAWIIDNFPLVIVCFLGLVGIILGIDEKLNTKKICIHDKEEEKHS